MGMGQGQTRGCSWKIEPTFSKGASDILRTVKQKTVKLARRQVTEAAEKVTRKSKQFMQHYITKL